MSSDQAIQSSPPPEPPYRVGDFGTWFPSESNPKKYALDWCPLCELDPDRPSYRFSERYSANERRSQHFFEEHTADEFGEPLEVLVERLRLDPEYVEPSVRGTELGAAHHDRAKTAKTDHEQHELSHFGGDA